ncbi:MAG: 4Fe-4S binding protein [Proteobacteria bacterium]|nr:4Fe-4S binding protein [Pseudomonadota bacterium]
MKKPSLHAVRRTVQVVTAVSFIVIPLLNHFRISFVYGNFLSFRFFMIPLADPLAVLQIFLKNNYLSADLIIGAAIALVLAAILGTVFCSWICPFGLFSEWAHMFSRRWKKKRKSKKSGYNISGFKMKSGLFIIGIIGFLVFSTTPVLNQLSLPAWYSRIFQFWFEQWHVSLAILGLGSILIIEVLMGRRLWCRYICPQSVLITLAKQVNPRRMRVCYDTEKCLCRQTTNHPCHKACSLGFDPKNVNRWMETDCTNCGECITACKKRGKALSFGFSKKL